MGSSLSSSSKGQRSTPTIGYGRGLRVAHASSATPPSRTRTPPARFAHHASHQVDGASPSPFLPRSTSWHGQVTEQTALLFTRNKPHLSSPLQLDRPHHRYLKHDHHAGSSSSSSSIGEASLVAPPLAVWIIPALLCALSYALYNIFIKKGSASIHPVLGGVILQFVAAFLGIFLLLFIVVKDNGISELHYDYHGVQWAICAGIAVGLAEMVSFFVSSLGVQAMQSIPIIIGGSVLFGTLLGFALLGEALSLQGWIGVGLLVGGICLVGTDPAATSISE